jgi:hypothetical protein
MRDASVWMQSFGQFDTLDLDALERLIEAVVPSDGTSPD